MTTRTTDELITGHPEAAIRMFGQMSDGMSDKAIDENSGQTRTMLTIRP